MGLEHLAIFFAVAAEVELHWAGLHVHSTGGLVGVKRERGVILDALYTGFGLFGPGLQQVDGLPVFLKYQKYYEKIYSLPY